MPMFYQNYVTLSLQFYALFVNWGFKVGYNSWSNKWYGFDAWKGKDVVGLREIYNSNKCSKINTIQTNSTWLKNTYFS